MIRCMLLVALSMCGASVAHAGDVKVTFESSLYFLPAPKAIVVCKAGSPSPGERGHASLATASKIGDALTIAVDGPVDVWYVPVDGKPMRAASNVKLAGDTAIKLHDGLGVIQSRGTDQPRGALLITPHQDPGPEGKGHVVVQTGKDVRGEVVVMPGDYAVWVVPDSGARPRRLADKVRVLAGKTAVVD